jgi:hypothetical protein
MTSGRDLSAPRANFKPNFAQNAKSTAHQKKLGGSQQQLKDVSGMIGIPER